MYHLKETMKWIFTRTPGSPTAGFQFNSEPGKLSNGLIHLEKRNGDGDQISLTVQDLYQNKGYYLN